MENPVKFIREVRQEVSRVTWPTRKETTVSTGMVLLLVAVAAFFFAVVDYLISTGVFYILGIGGSSQ